MADFRSKLKFSKPRGNSIPRNVVSDVELELKSQNRSMPNYYARKEADGLLPRDARAVQVVESRRDKKKYLYKISVEWSDGTASHCYRSYTDFFNLQCKLLDTFPEEAGMRKALRSIPFLPGRQIFARSTRKLAEDRRPEIDNYLIDLLRLPVHISKHKSVCQFFRNNWEEDKYQDSPRKSAANEANFEFTDAVSDVPSPGEPTNMESIDSIGSRDWLI